MPLHESHPESRLVQPGDPAARLALLARAGELLAESLDYETTLANVARLVVSEMADWCIIYDVDGNDRLRRLSIEHADPSDAELARRLMTVSTPGTQATAAMMERFRRGEAFINNDFDDARLEAAADSPEHLDILRRMRIVSTLGVPMVARGKFVGSIVLLSTRSNRHYDETDAALALDLARRAALAIDNALLYRTAQEEIAERQRAEGERNALLHREQEQRRELEIVLESMQKIEVRVRRLFEANVVGILFSTFDGTIHDANDAFLDIIGYTREELRNGALQWDRLTPEEYAEVSDSAVQELREKGACTPFEKEYLRKDGSRLAVLIGGALIDGTTDTVVWFVIDISERYSAERALRDSEKRNRALLQAIPDLIFRLSADGIMLECISEDDTRLAFPREEFIGRNVMEVFPDTIGPESMKLIGEVLATGQMRRFEYTLRCDDVDRFYESRLVPGGGDEVISIVRDITERHRHEVELRQAKEEAEKASIAKDQFLAVLSHELRTPLTPVIAAVQAMKWEELSEAALGFLDIIERNAQLEVRLIDDLLDLKRIEHGKLMIQREKVDAHQFVEAAVGVCRQDAESKGLTMFTQLGALSHHVNGDSARLQQVLWNLLRNAIKFTPAGGTITVTTAESGDGRLRITVSDTGVGIEPELLPRIFDAFEQGEQAVRQRSGGMGLGLAISRMLAEMHGGSLTVQSEGVGRGASFTLLLETISEERTADNPSTPKSADTRQPQQIRVLVVDDHVDTGNVLRLLLERDGHLVETALSLREAIERAEADSFDLLISDIGLPDGSGIELIEQLGDRRPARAIALSGFGMDEDVRRSLDAGFAQHLTKPVTMARLREVIASLFS